MRYITTIIAFIIITNVQALSLLDKKVRLNNSKDDLRTVFIAILQQTGIPVLYEGCPQKKTLVNIPKTSGTVKEILNALSGSKYSWSLKDGVLLFQNKEFIKEPYYPLKKYRFNFSVDTEDLQKYLNKSTFFDDLWKERINNWGMRCIYTSKRSFKKTYKETSLRDILLDILKGSNSFGSIYKYSPADSAATYKSVKKSKTFDYKLIKDAGEPLYGLAIRSYKLRALKKAFVPETILDGNKKLKCSLVFSYSDKKEAQIKINIKNISSEKLFFKDFKKDNLIVFDYASKDDTRKKLIGCFLVYPPLNSDIPEDFHLSPSKEKTFTFILKGSRFIPFKKGDIMRVGFEKQYNYKPLKAKILQKPHSFSFFRPIIYFYDSKGAKYKAVNKEFIDTAEIRK